MFAAVQSDSNHLVFGTSVGVPQPAGNLRGGEHAPPFKEQRLRFARFFRQALKDAAGVYEDEVEQLPKWWASNEAESPIDPTQLTMPTPEELAASSTAPNVTVWPPDVVERYGMASLRPYVPAPTRPERSFVHVRTLSRPSATGGDAAAVRATGAAIDDNGQGASAGGGVQAALSWIGEALPFYTADESFFTPNGDGKEPIQCHFSMPNIINEAHFDDARTFISMERGRKRFILLPPDQCANLGIVVDGPGARHTAWDWTNPEDVEKLAGARGLEVVLEAGEVLYVPAFWFRMSVSLTVSVQCEKRSGTPPVGDTAIRSCGFDVKATEALGEFTSDEAAASGVTTPAVVPPASFAIPGITEALQTLSRSQNAPGSAAAAAKDGIKALVPIDVLVPREERVPAAKVLSILRVETTLGSAPLDMPLIIMAPPEEGAAAAEPAAESPEEAATKAAAQPDAAAEREQSAPMEEQAERENVVPKERAKADTGALPGGQPKRAAQNVAQPLTKPPVLKAAQPPVTPPVKSAPSIPPALVALGRTLPAGDAKGAWGPRAARPVLPETGGGSISSSAATAGSSRETAASSGGSGARTSSLLDTVSSSYFVYVVLVLGGLELLLLAYLFCRFRSLCTFCCGGAAASAARRHGLMAIKTGPRV